MDMPTKSFELDIVSTGILKQVVHSCFPAIMKIINLLLDKGDFNSQWKSMVVCPVIKSLSKGTTNNKYRPVINLPFISKVAEKCTLQQLLTRKTMEFSVPQRSTQGAYLFISYALILDDADGYMQMITPFGNASNSKMNQPPLQL